MDRQRYIEEGYRQLNGTSVHLRTHATAISDIQHLADQLHIEAVNTHDIRQLAIGRHTNLPRFYLPPKVHKKMYQADQLFLHAVQPLKECQK